MLVFERERILNDDVFRYIGVDEAPAMVERVVLGGGLERDVRTGVGKQTGEAVVYASVYGCML